MTTLQKPLSAWCLFILLAVLASTNACSKKEQNNGEQKPQTPVPEVREPNKEPERQWVTTQQETFNKKGAVVALETSVFGPDGARRRWVKLEQGRRIKLAEGEWVAIHGGKKYRGRAGGRSEIWLESGEIKSRNVDIGNSEK